MSQKQTLGETDSAIANVALAIGVAVKWHTVAGQIVACGVGDIPIGYTMEAIAALATGAFMRAGRGNRLYPITAAGVSIGDYLKCGAAGVLVQEATPTTPTAFTVAQASSATDSAGYVTATTTR
jgi:hypothetical protein